MADQGNLLQLIDRQTYLGQELINVYYYRVTPALGITGNYLELLNDSWEEIVLPTVVKFQTGRLSHVQREWRNLSNNLDLFIDSTVVTGTATGSTSVDTPSYVSLGFQLNRESLATRNGYKRFGGLPDDGISGNTWTGNPDDISDCEEALGSDLFIGLISSAEPVIVKRPIEPPVGSYVYASIGSATFRGLGSQNTRKQGRGV